MDSGGQEWYRIVKKGHYRGLNAIIIVFDKSTRKSFDYLESWLDEINMYASENTLFLIVGNKCDLEPEVSIEEVQDKALKYQALYIEVSSKCGENIQDLFEIMIRTILQKINEKQG